MTPHPTLRGVAIIAAIVLLAGCQDPRPSAVPSNAVPATPGPSSSLSPEPSVAPSPTAGAVPQEFPLAVVTGLRNLKANISLEDLAKLGTDGKLVAPCGVEVKRPPIARTAACIAADQIPAAIEGDQQLVALLPAGLVEPATKVISIAGDGPFGMFGPDLFGDPEARSLPYPVIGSATGEATIDPAWTTYDAATVWTLRETGSLCADRGAARQAVTNGKGWDWVFGGGTAKYNGPPVPNPNPPPGIDRHPIVRPIETGNGGATSTLIRRADVTLGNLKCPVLPSTGWKPSTQALGLSVPEDVLTRWKDSLGIDVLYLPADHQSDRGVRGIRSTLDLLDKHGFPGTGLGMNLDEALEPAYIEVAGQKVAFVAWNDVPAPTHAAANTPGVAWLTEANVNESVRRAQAANADVVVCDPQWWGGSEYRAYLRASQRKQVAWMDAAGCDQILAGGLHIAGGVFLRRGEDGVRMINAGPGNFQYGQDFWNETQEGVVVEQVFRGATLVNTRLYPYVMILAARAALTDPEGDGHYVLERIWKSSETDYLP